MAILYLVRHGESTANVQGILSSRVTDTVELTDKGVIQTLDAADLLPDEITTVYTSPLLRTVQSAKLIAVLYEGDLEIVSDPRIAEIDYGEFSGKANNAALDSVRKRQKEGDLEVRFGGTGENRKEITTRVQQFLDTIAARHGADDVVVVVTHGSILRWIERLVLVQEPASTVVDNGAVHIARIE